MATFKGHNGVELYYQYWPAGKARGTIIVVHGVGEHSSRYGHLGRSLASRGYTVYAYDQRGNGRSCGKRGHIMKFEEYLLDLKAFIAYLRPPGKVFVLGHSLGGLTAIRFAMNNPADITAVIATSPALALELRVPLSNIILGRLLSFIYPAFVLTDNAIPSKYLSHDPDVCRAYDNDPLVHRARTARFFTEFMKASADTFKHPERLTVPALILQAGDDRIVSPAAAEKFFSRIASVKKFFRAYPGFYHEILNETEKNRVIGDIAGFIECL